MKTSFRVAALSAFFSIVPLAFAGGWGGHSSGAGHVSGGHIPSGHFSGGHYFHHFGHFRGHDHVFFDLDLGWWGWPYYGPYYYYGPEYYPVYDGGYSVATDVQAALARRGFYPGDIDGIIGPVSREAIRRYQASRGMRVTGVIDQALIDSLGLG
jgi:hypothetical protein